MIYKVTGKQYNSRMCFICGLKNSFGLKTFFYETDKNKLIALFKPCQEHQGYPGRLHGGIAAAVLDETIGRTVTMGKEDEIWGVTLEFSIKFKKPIPLDEEIKVITELKDEDKRFFKGTGKIVLADGKVAATASGRYLKLPIEKISDFDRDINEWKVVRSKTDPATINI